MERRRIISPSILSTDFLQLRDTVRMVNDSEADWIHMDIMDGVYVPNLSFGLPIAEAVGRFCTKPMDVHLMIVHPENYLESFARAGAANITVHFEACTHLHSTVQRIRQLKCRPGVALNPHTDVSLLKPILAEIDLALIMTVNPGFGGQEFIEHSYEKISGLRELAEKSNPDLFIEVDGGISDKNIARLSAAGADCFVAGTFVFNSQNPVDTINRLKHQK